MPVRRAEASIKACRTVELVRQGKSYDAVARAVRPQRPPRVRSYFSRPRPP
jgi:hypothetical protein